MHSVQLPQIFSVIPAKGHITASGAYIDYYTPGPDGRRVRHIIRCNRQLKPLRNRYEKLRHLARLVAEINAKLLLYTPPADTTPAPPTPAPPAPCLADACKAFLSDKQKYLRRDTMRTYASICRRLAAWSDNAQTPVNLFDRRRALDYLDNLNGVGNRAYNNNLKQCRAVFTWFVERGLCAVNPFADIPPRRVERKTRVIIPADDRARILSWCDEHLPYYSLALMLVYSSLIRPKELRLLRLCDVNLASHQIRVAAAVAKNHNERYATFTKQIERRLAGRVDKRPGNWYLFGVGGEPGPQPLAEKRLLKDWYKVKAALRLPDAYQLYSLRDTGITDLIKAGVDEITVMNHADHSNLKITSIYARHQDNRLAATLYDGAPEF